MATSSGRDGTRVRRPSRAAARSPSGRTRLSRLHPPPDMSLEVWQLALRRQYGREQAFVLKKLGGHPIFSEFEVENPRSRTSYRVVIRGSAPGSNFCACPDLATNSLGTCKHIEFVLGWLERPPRAPPPPPPPRPRPPSGPPRAAGGGGSVAARGRTRPRRWGASRPAISTRTARSGPTR